MALIVRPDDAGCIFGDSNSAGSNGPSQFAPLLTSITGAYMTTGTPPGPTVVPRTVAPGVTRFNQGSPRVTNLSVAGQTSNDLVSRLAEIYALNPHWVIIEIEVNDSDPAAAISNATWTANINTAIAGIRANCPRLRWLLWVQAVCFGEVRPFGSNANDTTATGLGAKDDILRQRAAALVFDVVEVRTDSTASGGGNGPWLTYEAANNPSNLASGVLTSDQRHVNANGAPFMSSLVFARLTVETA